MIGERTLAAKAQRRQHDVERHAPYAARPDPTRGSWQRSSIVPYLVIGIRLRQCRARISHIHAATIAQLLALSERNHERMTGAPQIFDSELLRLRRDRFAATAPSHEFLLERVAGDLPIAYRLLCGSLRMRPTSVPIMG